MDLGEMLLTLVQSHGGCHQVLVKFGHLFEELLGEFDGVDQPISFKILIASEKE